MTACDQSELVDWLASPEAHGGGDVNHIETQISHVFLSGDRVYKLKKAVAPGFLDYTMPEKRRAAAETELTINRRTAPEIYLAVEPVRRAGNGFSVGEGSGDIVDWLVVMRRFDQDELFDALANTERLETSHVRDLADALADLHKRAERRPEKGGREGMRHHYAAPLDALDKAEDLPFDRSALAPLRERLGEELSRLAPRLEARRRHGRVLHGHGDLHLGNACLFKGKATLFDAIEFSDDIACVDALYDAAFTVMDLLAHDRRELAALFLNRYLEATGDYSGLACLPFFIAIRALVRAMSNALSGSETKAPWARIYYDLAVAALDWDIRPQAVAIGGFSGTGKSTIAKGLALHLAPGPGGVHLRSDGIRKRLAGVAPEEPLPQDAYSKDVNRRTYLRLERNARRALLAGWPLVLDATFTRPESRTRVAELARALRVPFAGLWLEADPDTLRSRVAGREADASDADLTVLERQLTLDIGEVTWRRVSAEGKPESVLDAARMALDSPESA